MPRKRSREQLSASAQRRREKRAQAGKKRGRPVDQDGRRLAWWVCFGHKLGVPIAEMARALARGLEGINAGRLRQWIRRYGQDELEDWQDWKHRS